MVYFTRRAPLDRDLRHIELGPIGDSEKELLMSESLCRAILREIESVGGEIHPSDLMVFSEPLRSALSAAIRAGRFSLTEFSKSLGCSRKETLQIAEVLSARKLLSVESSNAEEIYYRARLTGMTRPLKRPPSDIWKRIE